MQELSRETLELAQAGDVEAYRALVETYQRPVFHTVFRLVGARFRADVEDITQDIFVKLYRTLPQFDPARGTRLSSWVFTFVKNYCFDVLKRRRLKLVPLEAPPGDSPPRREVAGKEREPREELASQELQETIAHAVDLLPDDQKAAFVLREYEGLSYSDIAGITGSSEGTVKSRIHRAKEALRYRLRKVAPEAGGGSERRS